MLLCVWGVAAGGRGGVNVLRLCVWGVAAGGGGGAGGAEDRGGNTGEEGAIV